MMTFIFVLAFGSLMTTPYVYLAEPHLIDAPDLVV